jgi:serine/threonine-protein kinase
VVRTRTGTVVGTPAYLAPELAAGRREVDRRADVYGLGVMAYQLLVGRLPFAGDSYQLLVSHIEMPPPRPVEVIPGFPVEVEAVLLRALAKQPGERLDRAGEFTEALIAAAAPGWPPAPEASLGALVRQSFEEKTRMAATADVPTAPATRSATDPAGRVAPELPAADVPVFRPADRRLAVVIRVVVAALVATAVAAAVVVLLAH